MERLLIVQKTWMARRKTVELEEAVKLEEGSGAGGDIVAAWIRWQLIHPPKAQKPIMSRSTYLNGLVSPAKEIGSGDIIPALHTRIIDNLVPT